MLYTTDATVMPIHNLRQRLDMVDRSIDDDGAQSTQANECALRESDSERRSREAHGTATPTKRAHISRSRTGSLAPDGWITWHSQSVYSCGHSGLRS